VSSLKNSVSCALLEQVLSYLTLVRGRSALTAEEYSVDCLMLFEYIKRMRGVPQSVLAGRDFSDVNAEFLRSVSAADLYAFITYCGEVRKVTAAPRARKFVSIRQFWKYLKNKAHLLTENLA
jgi:site-specific recombinase XerD